MRASVALAGGGASNAWLQPGPQSPEALGFVAPELRLVYATENLRLVLDDTAQATGYLESQLTGLSDDARIGLSLWPRDDVRIDLRVLGSVSTYNAGGPALVGSTLPLLATRSLAVSGGLGLAWRPGPLGVVVGWLATPRQSDATFTDGTAATPIDEVLHQGTLQLVWRPGPRTDIRLGPVAEIRATSDADLAYTGVGLEARARTGLWHGALARVGLRAQANRFGGTYARDDLFARLDVGLSQRIGRRLRLTVTYAYTANGSPLAAFDADRHLVMVVVEGWVPWLRF